MLPTSHIVRHHAGTGGSIVRRALVQSDVGQESDGKAHFVASGWSVPGSLAKGFGAL